MYPTICCIKNKRENNPKYVKQFAERRNVTKLIKTEENTVI